MDSTGPVRDQGDLAEMVELLLEKGVVINADVVVSVGDTELLGVELRAAIASFETAAKYGLEFPDGTDRERVIEAANASSQEIDGEGGDQAAGEAEGDSGRARSLRLRPGGPAGSGDGEGDTAEPASAADKGASEVARKTPAGAGDVTIDPAPYDATREDRDPDADEPGVDHPDVEGDDDGDDESADTGSGGDGSAESTAAHDGADDQDGSTDADDAEDEGEQDDAGTDGQGGDAE